MEGANRTESNADNTAAGGPNPTKSADHVKTAKCESNVLFVSCPHIMWVPSPSIRVGPTSSHDVCLLPPMNRERLPLPRPGWIILSNVFQ
ncbi:unnamed protein product [Sphenostylis stenocarpa]|uniref:Uncharacterized protein n=1 Tax=Sphenostylis stenocarpa TaxID=92480 RepID=A0AA86VC75_9FABA|nr:unnamed protein product [Sphenostylis stenocarpa]